MLPPNTLGRGGDAANTPHLQNLRLDEIPVFLPSIPFNQNIGEFSEGVEQFSQSSGTEAFCVRKKESNFSCKISVISFFWAIDQQEDQYLIHLI
ncbi:MAG: hypothetical protein EA362_02765 [Saprospirales bacterium]|nr:MAG: hypothetical protein EA362_02765 [Saprospirales bacterium]